MTITCQQKLFELFTENQISEDIYRDVLRVVTEDQRDSDKANMEMNRLYQDNKRNYENLQKHLADVHMRHNSKLMSVYYLLDMVADAGTHSEKRNVIMYLKLVIEKLIHKGDPLPINPENLPF